MRNWILAAGAAALALPAYAQDAPGAGASILSQLLLFAPLILIFYLLIWRPQSQQRKRHQAMIDAVKRGDTVITAGGIKGKVTKVTDDELVVEISDGVRVTAVKGTLMSVLDKTKPVAANDQK